MLIVGLGNPGREYSNTRHNAGFNAVDLLAKQYNSSWNYNKSFSAEISSIYLNIKNCDSSVKRLKLILCKPLLYMNRSGESVSKVLSYFHDYLNESLDNSVLFRKGFNGIPLIVLHDELDFRAGIVRLKKDGSSGGHNGVSDIIKHIGSKNFIRIRIGISHPRDYDLNQMSVSDWVLSSPKNSDEIYKLEKGINSAAEAVIDIIENGYEKASSNLNQSQI